MKINIMTLFPEMFEPIRASMIGRAADNGIIELNIVNIRDYTEDKHCRVDDTPFGGGAGMLMQVQPIISCYRQNDFAGRTIYMSPRGRKLSQEAAEELAGEGELTILCGHYEGVDERALTELCADGRRAARDGASRCGCQICSGRAGIRRVSARGINLFWTSRIPSVYKT